MLDGCPGPNGDGLGFNLIARALGSQLPSVPVCLPRLQLYALSSVRKLYLHNAVDSGPWYSTYRVEYT